MNNDPIGVLNYALTLEHLEDALYNGVLSTGLLTGQARTYAEVYGAHEHTHVVTLTQVIQKLGGTPVSPQKSYNWPTFSSANDVVKFLQSVEDLGAAAYLGAAPMLMGNDELLTAAVEIHTVEAYHATGWRLIGYSMGLNDKSAAVPFAFAEGKTMKQVLDVVGPLLGPGMPNTGLGGGARSADQGRTLAGAAAVGVVSAAAVGLRMAARQEPATEGE